MAFLTFWAPERKSSTYKHSLSKFIVSVNSGLAFSHESGWWRIVAPRMAGEGRNPNNRRQNLSWITSGMCSFGSLSHRKRNASLLASFITTIKKAFSISAVKAIEFHLTWVEHQVVVVCKLGPCTCKQSFGGMSTVRRFCRALVNDTHLGLFVGPVVTKHGAVGNEHPHWICYWIRLGELLR